MRKGKRTPITPIPDFMTIAKLLFSSFICLIFSGQVWAQEFLEVDQAFKLRVEVRDKQLAAVWDIADGYKLYQSSLAVKAIDAGVTLPTLILPPAKSGFDKGLNKVVQTYLHSVTGTLPLPAATPTFELEVSYQGCAVAGLCYPPQTRSFRVEPQNPGLQVALNVSDEDATPATAVASASSAGATLMATQASAESSPSGAEGAQEVSIQSVLQGGNLLKIGAAFLVFGLLLSLTPCVLPMLPILSSIIVGQTAPSRRRSFLLAVSYSMGMALVYTSLGLAAGLVGEGLAAFMQKPWVLGVFALLLTAMALSMFDVFELQLPASWQGRMSQWSGRFEGGQYFSVFVMGALSSLIVGPCVAGPLAGALLYISQTRDVFIGGFALFVMACGMSVPLLLTGLSAGSLLPRVGSWMLHIKSVFGFMLLGVALWMVNPLMNSQVRLMAWGAWLVLAALFTPLFSHLQSTDGFSIRLGRAMGLLVLLAGMAEFTGGMMGHTEILTPLKSPTSNAANVPVTAHVQFERIAGMQALDQVLSNSDRPVVLDSYADWCASCLEMEQFTFTDPKVIEKMQGWRKLQVDVTNNTQEDREFMRRFQLFGPPAMIFFQKNGTEFSGTRLMGYLPASAFNQHLDKFSKAN